MLIYKNNELKLSEPRLKEYRLILEYIHASTDEIKIKNRYLKLLNIVCQMYQGQIAPSELKHLVDNNNLIFSDTVKLFDGLNIQGGHGIQSFLLFSEWLVAERLKEITELIGNYTQLIEVKSTNTNYTKNQSIETVRLQLSEWYKSLVFKGQIITWSELDGLSITDFEALKDYISVDTRIKNAPIEIEFDEDFLNELGVEIL